MRKIKRNIVGAFIFSADGKLLLDKSVDGGVYPGCWMVPGGGVDDGETIEEALKREVLEETGIDIEDSEIEQLNHNHSGEQQKTLRDTGETVIVQMEFFDHKVTMPHKAEEVEIVNGDDFTDARWYDKSDLPSLNLSPPGIKSLKKLGLL